MNLVSQPYQPNWHIYCGHLSLIIVPPCCKKISGSSFFDLDEKKTLFKDSIIFACPICKVAYPKIHDVFKSIVVLNISLSSVNLSLETYKKNGFDILVSTPASAYPLLDYLVQFKNVDHFIAPDRFNDHEFIFKEVSRLISLCFDAKSPHFLPKNGIKLGPLSVLCHKCDFIFSLQECFIKDKRIACPECGNSQIIARKYFKDLQLFYNEFQNSIDHVNKDNIIVAPISITGAYQHYKERKPLKPINEL